LNSGEVKEEKATLAVIALKERDGSTRFLGEDMNGKQFNLHDVSQPAILLVPKDTLPHLKGDAELWARVKNPEVAFDEKEKLTEAEEG